MCRSLSDPLLSDFLSKILLYAFPIIVHTTCFTILIRQAVVIFGERHELWTFAFCSFPRPSVFLFYCQRQIFCSALGFPKCPLHSRRRHNLRLITLLTLELTWISQWLDSLDRLSSSDPPLRRSLNFRIPFNIKFVIFCEYCALFLHSDRILPNFPLCCSLSLYLPISPKWKICDYILIESEQAVRGPSQNSLI